MANIGSLTAHLGVDTTGLRSAGAEFQKFQATTTAGLTTMTRAAGLLGAAFASLKITQVVSDAAMMAARYETLGVVMATVGKNAGYSAGQMESFAKGLQKSGIAMIESRTVLTRMAQAHIDLSKSTELARIAQDAAVIGNINSSEAFERMIHGIQSGQIEILRTIGINVNFQNSYEKLAMQLGKTSDELTENEKMQARVNVVMKAGEGIAGTYEAAMGTAGKQILSMKRYWDDLKTSAGGAVLEEMTKGTKDATEAVKGFSEYLQQNDVQQSIKDTAAGIAAIARALLAVTQASIKAGEMLGLNIIGKAMAFNRSANKFGRSVFDSVAGSIDPQTGLPAGAPSSMSLAQGHGVSNRMITSLAVGHSSSPVKNAEEEIALTKKQMAEAKRLAEQWADTKRTLEGEMNLSALTGLDKTLQEITNKAIEYRSKFGDKSEITVWEEKARAAAVYTDEMERLTTTMSELDRVQDAYFMASIDALPKEAQAVARLTEEYRKKQYAVQDALKQELITPATAMAQAHELELRQAEQNLEILNQQEDAAYAYQKSLEKLGKTGTTVAEDMKEAFTGWASNMSKDFNDVLWGAKVTFNGILESFGKMITQMMIQKSVVEPLTNNMGGIISGIVGMFSGGGGTPEAFSQVSAYDSMVGTGAEFSLGSESMPSVFNTPSAAAGYDVPPGVNPLTQLHEEEMVLPAEYANVIRGLAGAGGEKSAADVNIQMNLVNQSGQQLQAKSGGVQFDGKSYIVTTILEDIQQGGPLRGLFSGARA
jgi:hypothetical protein